MRQKKASFLYGCLLAMAMTRAHGKSVFSFSDLIVKAIEKSKPEALERNSEAEDLLVIGAGFGRTGTLSFVEALQRLGLKSYHMKAVVDTPGHLDLWSNFSLMDERGAESPTDAAALLDGIIDNIAYSGFNATADVPCSLFFLQMMKRYPEAKVVLTDRGEGGAEKWADSMLNTNGQYTNIAVRIPFRWMAFHQQINSVAKMARRYQGIPLHPKTQLPSKADLIKSYKNWNTYVKTQVPPERLLVFSAGDGYGPLCKFLAPLDSSIERRCIKILASDEVYPFTNKGTSMQQLFTSLKAVAIVFENFPLLFVVLAIWYISRRYRSRVKID
eukprot:CAMPEP_0198151916 /NCGR_PEP_ID=MMETSP1443-20131203/57699_1 /TAXON_ID=186043 /ORGANISM="Entomoneis sp., Strain CCMP2396" /LENGTH=328 /DNA_ID=CAMNT_0043817763 /DNA_START=128 /DNA_END=1114 /DNA_ORIENTATION=-